MSGNEVVERMKEAYIVGLVNFPEFEKRVTRGLVYGDRECPGASLWTPFLWEIERARAAALGSNR